MATGTYFIVTAPTTPESVDRFCECCDTETHSKCYYGMRVENGTSAWESERFCSKACLNEYHPELADCEERKHDDPALLMSFTVVKGEHHPVHWDGSMFTAFASDLGWKGGVIILRSDRTGSHRRFKSPKATRNPSNDIAYWDLRAGTLTLRIFND